MRPALVTLILLLLLPAPAPAAELYRYTDDRGVIHFISAPEEAPARFRDRVSKVKGRVSVVTPGGEPRPPALEGGLPEFESLPLTPGLIVALELWRSRLIFSLAVLAALAGIFLLGLGLTREIPSGKRWRHRVRLCVSFAAVLVLFWLSLFGPGLGRMLRGCEAGAARGLERAAEPARLERLERLRRAAGQSAEAVESLLPSIPA